MLAIKKFYKVLIWSAASLMTLGALSSFQGIERMPNPQMSTPQKSKSKMPKMSIPNVKISPKFPSLKGIYNVHEINSLITNRLSTGAKADIQAQLGKSTQFKVLDANGNFVKQVNGRLIHDPSDDTLKLSMDAEKAEYWTGYS